MIPFLKNLLYDSSAFERYTRAILLALAGIAATGQLNQLLPTWTVAIFLGLGGLIGAGDKTLSTLADSSKQELKDAGVTPEPEKK